ncbi:MAG: hypothetical protein IKN82_02475, partial [Treponema sp.]|nr:hypothetical protein [Treponema sp.]
VTPLERWIDTDVDLDPVAVERLNRLAALSNQSVDNVVNHILADFFAEHLELSELNADTLSAAAKKCPCILVLENGKPIARVKMISWGAGKMIFASEKTPPKNRRPAARNEPVAKCDKFVTAASAVER